MKYEIFYRGQFPITAICGNQQKSIIRTAKHMLAQSLQGTIDTVSILQCTDNHRSIIQTSVSLLKNCYTPFGFTQNTQTQPLPTLFNGELLDVISTAYLLGNGHRTYSPILMRFLSADRLSPFSLGGINTYAYCSNDPINFADPSGQTKTKYHQPRSLRDQSLFKFLDSTKHIPQQAEIKNLIADAAFLNRGSPENRATYMNMKKMLPLQLEMHANPSEFRRILAVALSSETTQWHLAADCTSFFTGILRADAAAAKQAFANVIKPDESFTKNMLKTIKGEYVNLPLDHIPAANLIKNMKIRRNFIERNLFNIQVPPFNTSTDRYIKKTDFTRV